MLAGRYDSPMPESSISPSQGTLNLAAANNTSILSPPCLHFAQCQSYSGFGKKRNLLLVFRFQRTESSEYDENFLYNKVRKNFVWNRKTFFQASRVDFFINQMSSNNQRKNTLSHYPAKSPPPPPTASYILEKFNI
jgi:hypothetical protein